LSIVIRFLVLVFGLAVAIPVSADTLTGRVVNVANGDTVTIQDGANQSHVVRLSGIEAPDKVQAFGNQATSSLAAMVFDRAVVARCSKRDRHGRDVCTILLDGRDINLEQLKAGMAWWEKHNARDQTPGDRSAYEQAQFWALAHRSGLWRDSNPLPPWEFRHER
jgi:endonuclease YncB( thermonuclease family)